MLYHNIFSRVNGTCVYEDLFEDTTFDVIYDKRAEFLEETTGKYGASMSVSTTENLHNFTTKYK